MQVDNTFHTKPQRIQYTRRPHDFANFNSSCSPTLTMTSSWCGCTVDGNQWAAFFTHSVIVLAGPSVFPPQTSHRVQFYQKFAWNLQVDETELGPRSRFFRRTHGNEGIRRVRRLGMALPKIVYTKIQVGSRHKSWLASICTVLA